MPLRKTWKTIKLHIDFVNSTTKFNTACCNRTKRGFHQMLNQFTIISIYLVEIKLVIRIPSDSWRLASNVWSRSCLFAEADYLLHCESVEPLEICVQCFCYCNLMVWGESSNVLPQPSTVYLVNDGSCSVRLPNQPSSCFVYFGTRRCVNWNDFLVNSVISSPLTAAN